MKKILLNLVFSLFAFNCFAQTDDAAIKEIQQYIQNTSQSGWFDPVNKTGSLDDGSTYDLAYYILPEEAVFSIIYTVFDKNTLRKVFYYKNNELIAAIIEEHDGNNANKLLWYADYFYKDSVLINTKDEKENIPSNTAYLEGMKKLKEAGSL
ncbi:MAG TPA: hypothetical protein VKY33_06615 [Flavobacterium sp.]|nr:hypothetical protein [Flavobacterium sp.]